MFKAVTSEGIHAFMTAFNLGMKTKGNLKDSVLKCVSHVRVLMGVTSNGKIKKNANQAKENFSRRAVVGGGIKREKKLDLSALVTA